MRNKILIAMMALAGLVLARNVYTILLQLGDEAQQGAIYRIMFFHIPTAFTALLCAYGSMAASIAYLVRKNLRYDALGVAITEVGLAFGLVTLLTGMLWARPVWGIWWAWDARLTSYLILLLVYAGYLMLRQAVTEPHTRARLSAAMSVFAAADVPIVWYSIEWWRTQHPQPVLRAGGSLPKPWWNMVFENWGALLLIAIVLVIIRMRQEQTQRQIDALRQYAYAQ